MTKYAVITILARVDEGIEQIPDEWLSGMAGKRFNVAAQISDIKDGAECNDVLFAAYEAQLRKIERDGLPV